MDRLTRLDADLMRRTLTDDILVPLLYNSHTSEGSMFAKRAAVIRVVINNLPLPAAETPWEAIVDWRSDPEAYAKYRVLRAWIARLAREDWPSIDIQELNAPGREVAYIADAKQRF